MSNDLIKNYSQKGAKTVNHYPALHRNSETHASQNGNLEPQEVSKNQVRVQCQNMLQISKTRRDIFYLWKHATRHYRGGEGAGRATNQQPIHPVRPWNSHFSVLKNTQRVDVMETPQNHKKNSRKQEIPEGSAEKQHYGTIVERYLEDDQYQMRTHEQGCTQSDTEELDRDMKRGFTSLLLQNGLTAVTNIRSYNPSKKEAATP